MIGRAVALLLFLVAAPAFGEAGDGAQAHFENGRALYRLHKYDDAVREFNLGYAQLPLPEFLLDIGLAYRGLGDLPRARAAYRRFLDEAPADHPRRKAAGAMLADFDRAIAVIATPASPAPPPPKKRNVLVIALVAIGAVVLVGAAIGIAVAVAAPRDPTPSLGETVFRF